MNEHLLNAKEAAGYLGVDEKKLRELVHKKVVPAYKIGGSFLRFRKDQLGIVRSSMIQRPLEETLFRTRNFEENRLERAKDFLYFNDFYIVSAVLVILAIVVIFAS